MGSHLVLKVQEMALFIHRVRALVNRLVKIFAWQILNAHSYFIMKIPIYASLVQLRILIIQTAYLNSKFIQKHQVVHIVIHFFKKEYFHFTNYINEIYE